MYLFSKIYKKIFIKASINPDLSLSEQLLREPPIEGELSPQVLEVEPPWGGVVEEDGPEPLEKSPPSRDDIE